MVAILSQSLVLRGVVGVSGLAVGLGTAVAATPAASPNPKRHDYPRPDRDERGRFAGQLAGWMPRTPSACPGMGWSQA